MSTEIQRVKNQVALETSAAEVESCQSSGLTVTEWCKLNGINMKIYYYHLRKVREQPLIENSIVPLNINTVVSNIDICSGDIKINLPCSCTEETLSMIVRVLKNT